MRIDHPDGLYNPREYFTALQENYARLRGLTLPDDRRGLYLLGEKILSGDEELREDWPIHGTTGYDFTTHITQLLVDGDAEKDFSETYQKFIGRYVHFPTLVYEKKRLTMRLSLANDINVLGSILNRLSERNRLFRDYTLQALTTAVREVVACFPVYRTYLTHGSPRVRRTAPWSTAPSRSPNAATRAWKHRCSIFCATFCCSSFPPNTDEAGIAEHEHFVMKFQQCTGPIMAKGLEDTAFYIYNRLVALNEVGGEPQHFGIDVAEFHRTNAHDRRKWPHTMLATSTHDTKRAEDTRARIAALSEIAEGMAARAALVERAQPQAQGQHRGRKLAGPRSQRGISPLPDFARHLAHDACGGRGGRGEIGVRVAERGGARDLRRAHPGVHDQGHQGGEGQQ